MVQYETVLPVRYKDRRRVSLATADPQHVLKTLTAPSFLVPLLMVVVAILDSFMVVMVVMAYGTGLPPSNRVYPCGTKDTFV